MRRLLILSFFFALTTRVYAASSLPIPDGSGTAKGLMGIFMVPAGPLSNTLPKELKLAPELLQEDGTYPSAMFVGQHDDLSVDLDGKIILVAKHYSEATLTFTVVGPSDPTQRYTYTSKIVVDSISAMVMGWGLGYPKRFASINVSENNFYAEFSEKRPIVNLILRDAISVDQDAFQKNMAYLAENMHPTIGLTAFGWTCYDFIWDFANGSVEPVNAEVKFFSAFAGKALEGTYLSPQIDQSHFGSVRILSKWKMTNFRSCK